MVENEHNYFIIDENGYYVIGYVIDGNNVKYIAYSNQDSCSISVIDDYSKALNKMRNLVRSQNKLIQQKLISTKHIFSILAL